MGIKILFQNLKKYGIKEFFKRWKSGIQEVNDGASQYYTQEQAINQQMFGLGLMIFGSIAAAIYLAIRGLWFWSIISLTPMVMWTSQMKMMKQSKDTIKKIREEQEKAMKEEEANVSTDN